jgi:hypothetical protein
MKYDSLKIINHTKKDLIDIEGDEIGKGEQVLEKRLDQKELT